MDIRKLQRAIVDGLEDVKAQNIAVFNTEHLSPLFERVIVASGTSNRQTKALASSVRDAVKKRGMEVLRMEGEENGEWIIVDCGAAVCHVMQPAIREYYRLEEIWGGKPVRLKAAAAGGLPAASFASEPVHAGAEATAPAKPVAGRKAPRKTPAPGATPGKAAAPARASGAKAVARPAAKSAPTPGRKAAGKTTGRAVGKTAKATTDTPARKTRSTTPASRTPVKTVVAPRPRSASARPAATGGGARKAGPGGRGSK